MICRICVSHMQTLLNYLGVFWMRHHSPALSYRSQIFLIKATFVLFCSLVWNLAHQNLNFFLFIVRFLGIFAHILSLKRLFHHNRNDGSEFLRYVIIYSCKTWYNVLIHSHVIIWGLGRFVGWGGQLTFWGRGVQYKRESLQILDLQKLPSPLTFELFLCSE